jgi:hypothetical protein
MYTARFSGYSLPHMTRSTRLAILGGTLLVLIAGTALATQSPRATQQGPLTASHEPEAPPTAEDLAHAAERLTANEIPFEEGQLSALAADYGLGGAIRLLAWADAAGMSVNELRDLRDNGAGWGQLARDLPGDISPGLGSIMGNGGGHGRDNAPGQLKPKPNEDQAE